MKLSPPKNELFEAVGRFGVNTVVLGTIFDNDSIHQKRLVATTGLLKVLKKASDSRMGSPGNIQIQLAFRQQEIPPKAREYMNRLELGQSF